MLFSSEIFLFWFLPILLVSVVCLPQRGPWRNYQILAGSILFYAWGEPSFAIVLIVGTAIDYWLSRQIHDSEDERRRKLLLTASLALNLGILCYCKYADFLIEQAEALLGAEGWPRIGMGLPIGVSFFTFQKISYVVDVYRRHVAPARSVADCLLYVALFPQLIAGPIVRYHDVDQQIRSRRLSSDKFASGVHRFVVGLAKKVLIADPMAAVADAIFDCPIGGVPQSYAWLGAAAYTLQIYFDFSGYSDMAIGLGRMLGFEFLENFDRPYIARTFTEFWRRWHISLSRFMREYLYIPLGGNRVSRPRQYINLWIVFLASGLWHGASWNFVLWGAYQGAFLTWDRVFFLRWAERIPGLILRLHMIPLIMLSWVLFRADDLTHAWAYWGRMIGGGGPDVAGSYISREVWFDNKDLAVMVAGGVICILPWSALYRGAESRVLDWVRTSGTGSLVATALTLALLGITLLELVNSSYSPFIYFRF